MKFYTYIFIFIFSAFLLAPPVVSFFDIYNAFSDTSFCEEENTNNNKCKIGFDWDVISKSSCELPLVLTDKKSHFSKRFNNDKFCVYLNPTVPPPRIS